MTITIRDTLRAAAIGGALVAPAAVKAADFTTVPTPMAVMPMEVYDWEGFFAGATLGGAIFDVEASDNTDIITNDAPNISMAVPAYGLRLAYNWIPFDNNLVIGAEGDATFGLLTERVVEYNTAGTSGIGYEYAWDNVLALRARAGVSYGKVLTYITGGAAWANAVYTVEVITSSTSDCDSSTCGVFEETIPGLTFGAGMEYGYRDDVTVSFEFLQYDMVMAQTSLLDSGTSVTCSGADAEECTVFFNSSASTVRLGVNYRF